MSIRCVLFFFSSRRRHTRCALVTGVQTCALPIYKWQSRLASSFMGIDYEDWRVAAVLSKSGSEARIGFADGDTGRLPASAAQMAYRKRGTSAFVALKPGDLIAVKPSGNGVYARPKLPEVSGRIGRASWMRRVSQELNIPGGADA